MSNITIKSQIIKEKKDGLPILQNYWNTDSGSIKLLDSKEVKNRNFECWIYHLQNTLYYGIKTHMEALDFMKDLEFRINPNNCKTSDVNDIINYIHEKSNIRNELPYDIDGELQRKMVQT